MYEAASRKGCARRPDGVAHEAPVVRVALEHDDGGLAPAHPRRGAAARPRGSEGRSSTDRARRRAAARRMQRAACPRERARRRRGRCIAASIRHTSRVMASLTNTGCIFTCRVTARVRGPRAARRPGRGRSPARSPCCRRRSARAPRRDGEAEGRSPIVDEQVLLLSVLARRRDRVAEVDAVAPEARVEQRRRAALRASPRRRASAPRRCPQAIARQLLLLRRREGVALGLPEAARGRELAVHGSSAWNHSASSQRLAGVLRVGRSRRRRRARAGAGRAGARPASMSTASPRARPIAAGVVRVALDRVAQMRGTRTCML